jgi:hypothetical protein
LGLVASRLSDSEGKYLISRLAFTQAAFPFLLTAIFCWQGTATKTILRKLLQISKPGQTLITASQHCWILGTASTQQAWSAGWPPGARFGESVVVEKRIYGPS